VIGEEAAGDEGDEVKRRLELGTWRSKQFGAKRRDGKSNITLRKGSRSGGRSNPFELIHRWKGQERRYDVGGRRCPDMMCLANIGSCMCVCTFSILW